MHKFLFLLVFGITTMFAVNGWSQLPLHVSELSGDTWPAAKDLPVQAELPNPLVNAEGSPIESASEWAPVRERMLQILEEYGYGHAPPPPGKVIGTQLESKSLLEGAVAYRKVKLLFGEEGKLGFDIAIFTPTKLVGSSLPTIVNLSFSASERNAQRYRSAFERGYQVVTIDYRQLGADRPDYRSSAFFPAYPEYDWNDMAAWSWGLSRCIDYLVELPDVDASKIIALGVSRVGHAVLHAGAFDERIALVAPVGAGCAFRFCGKGRGGKEGLEEVVANVDYWFGPRLPEFVGHVEKLPFDQHWLVALAAPRRIILCDALNDPYCHGNAIAQTYLGAKPIFEMLQVKSHVAIHFRPGGHGMRDEDWTAILDFADQQLRGLPIDRSFDSIPAAEQLR